MAETSSKENLGSEIYDQASDWLVQNYGKALTAVGVIAVIGLAGFFLMRDMKSDRKLKTSSTNKDLRAV